jgi:hypothetical protein
MLLCMKRTGHCVLQLISDTVRWILRYSYHVIQATHAGFADSLGNCRKMLHIFVKSALNFRDIVTYFLIAEAAIAMQ